MPSANGAPLVHVTEIVVVAVEAVVASVEAGTDPNASVVGQTTVQDAVIVMETAKLLDTVAASAAGAPNISDVVAMSPTIPSRNKRLAHSSMVISDPFYIQW
jgi:hypothetical protein